MKVRAPFGNAMRTVFAGVMAVALALSLSPASLVAYAETLDAEGAVALADETVTTISGDCTVSSGGTYQFAEGAGGTITLTTTEDVTFVGNGVELDDSLNITTTANTFCIDASSTSGVHITLQDVYISNSSSSNVIDLTGAGNVLTIAGVNVVDHDVNAQAYASIHVDVDTELTVDGTGTLYFYKRTQGAGFGGDSSEVNGTIRFGDTGATSGPSVFAKGTKQGALIGAGASSSSSTDVPGAVYFNAGEYNLISNSRGAVIGGSAGSSGASSGTSVYVSTYANININVDYSGAAVGGGGYDGGNDASGGTLYVSGGTLRCYIDSNAAGNTTGWQGATYTAGVNDAAITAQRLDGDGDEAVYWCLFDTSLLETDADEYSAYVDGTLFYVGGNHEYTFIQEALDKSEQYDITSTPSNWVKMTEDNQDSNLYFYLTGEDHTLTVNGETFAATWDGETESFTVAATTVVDITDASVTLSSTSAVYTGADLAPDVTVALADGTALVEGTDYTLAWADADGTEVSEIVEAGVYTLTVTGCGLYTGTLSATFEVTECTHGSLSETWTWADDFTASVALVCENCGQDVGGAAEVTSEVTTDADCTTEGVRTYTATYTYGDATYTSTATETIAANGHTYVGVVTDPTCTEAGYTTYTCSSCDDSYVSDYTDALGHSFTSYVSNGDATCEADGTKTASCDNGCGTTDTVADEGSATGHTAADAVVENETVATCTSAGTYDSVVYCATCGTELSRETVEVAATGHDYGYESGAWEWADDYSSATYTVTCANDASHTITYTASVESATSGRTTTYTASAEVEGEVYTSEQSVALFAFEDVVEDSWYEQAVYGLFDAGYVNGYTDAETGELTGLYGVGDSVKRAQFVTILWRIACPNAYAEYEADYAATGAYSCENTTGLSDVKDDTYYTAAVNWGVSFVFITGYTSGKYAGMFRPGAAMSFQDMCLVIARYGGDECWGDAYYSVYLTDEQVESLLAGFADASSVSSYARKGMAWCVRAGLVSGYESASGRLYLKPAETVARERVATVIWRGIDLFQNCEI